MDAYIFASSASAAAVGVLAAAVRAGGAVHAVFPLEGDRGLYVAVFGQDAATVESGIGTVLGTAGVTGAETYRRADPAGVVVDRAYPTHCQVDGWVGFALLPDDATGQPPVGVPGIVGFAVVERDGQTHALVEVNGPRADVLASLQLLRDGAPAPVFTAYGDTSRGAWRPVE